MPMPQIGIPPPPKKNQTCVCGGSFFCSAKTKKETLVSNTPFYISIGKSPPHVRKHRHTLLCLVSVSVCVCVRVSHHCVRDPFWFGTVWGWLDGLNTVVAYGTDSSFFYSYPLVLEEKKSKCASLDEKRHIFCLVVVMRSCGTVVELYHSTSKKFHRHPPLPENRIHSAATAIDDQRLLVVGGTGIIAKSCCVYDTTRKKWSTDWPASQHLLVS